MTVHWFPGHMAKALREMKGMLAQVDVLIEVCDARIPQASRNPAFAQAAPQKPRLLVLNKADLADPAITRAWISHFEAHQEEAVACDSIRRAGLPELHKRAQALMHDRLEGDKARGRRFRPIRLLVAGIPNTGKSTLINAFSRRKAAQTADKPGLTRQLRWVRSGGLFELLDSPGVLPPKLDAPSDQWRLAATGAVRDDLLETEAIAWQLWQQLAATYPHALHGRYRVQIDGQDPLQAFEAAARARGCLRPGGLLDLNRFSVLLLDEFRGGLLGPISLEKPPE